MNESILGKRFSRWLVIKEGFRKCERAAVLCRCDCGNEKVLIRQSITRSGTSVSKSCGCLNSESLSKRNLTHGLSNKRIYRSWRAMKNRCDLPKSIGWKYYGGKGIRYCNRWKSFEKFLKDMGPQPTNKHSIDRIDSNGNYEPKNCRWATSKEQNDRGRKKMSSPTEKAKVKKVMHEFKHGELHSGSDKGPKVSSRTQALAIALSEAKRAKKGLVK